MLESFLKLFKKKTDNTEEMYKIILGEIKDYAIYAIDTFGNVVSWNKGAENIKGYSSEEIIGKNYEIFFTAEDRASNKPQKELSIAFNMGRFEKECVRVRKDNTQFLANIVITPIYDQGVHCGFAKITKDLTQQHNLETIDKQRNDFLAMLAHELRNPLAPVRTIVHLIREQYGRSLDDNYYKMDSIINRQLDHISNLIDGLLDVARVTHGKIKLNLKSVPVWEAIECVLNVLRSQNAIQKYKITVDCPKNIIVYADSTRLEQIITNLLNNALKFTEEGKEISIVGKKEKNHVCISVRDSGSGISPEALPYIFDLFYQSDQTIERSKGGLGLGLTIVKKLMELHGGCVKVNTTLGSGTTFDICFPMSNNKRILIVEDNQDMANSLSILFSLDNHEIKICNNGTLAVDVAKDFEPDVVILDVGLPGFSGFEVARALRSVKFNRHVKIFIYSGYSRPEDIQLAKNIGVDEYIIKPSGYEKIRSLLS